MASTTSVLRVCAPCARCGRGPRPADARMPAGSVSLLLAALLLFGCAADDLPERGGSTAPAELSASVDRTAGTIGDVFTWEVVVERDPGVEVNLAEPATDIEGLRLVDLGRGPVDTLASGRIVERRWYRLRAEQVGSWTLPALTGTWVGIALDSPDDGVGNAARGPSSEGGAGDAEGGGFATAEIALEVESVLPDDASEVSDIRDIKPLRRVEDDPRWLLWTGLAALAAALLAGAWWWWRRRRPRGGDAPEAPAPPPWELALSELDRLRGADISDLRALRRYHFRLSSVVRAYVEGRFGLNATDLTTEEILARLPPLGASRTPGSASDGTSREASRRHQGLAAAGDPDSLSDGLCELDPARTLQLKRFLLATDQVKFASHLPEREEVERTFERAVAFVEATRPAEGDGQDDEQVDGDAAGSSEPSEAGADRSGRAA